MGYYTYASGELIVKPRLSDAMIAKLAIGDDDNGSDLLAIQGGNEDIVGLVDGEIKVIPGDSWTKVEIRSEEPYKADDTAGEVSALCAAATQEGCTVNGILWFDGENSDDFWRIRVEDNVMVEESPEFVWPNGDRGWGRVWTT